MEGNIGGDEALGVAQILFHFLQRVFELFNLFIRRIQRRIGSRFGFQREAHLHQIFHVFALGCDAPLQHLANEFVAIEAKGRFLPPRGFQARRRWSGSGGLPAATIALRRSAIEALAPKGVFPRDEDPLRRSVA